MRQEPLNDATAAPLFDLEASKFGRFLASGPPPRRMLVTMRESSTSDRTIRAVCSVCGEVLSSNNGSLALDTMGDMRNRFGARYCVAPKEFREECYAFYCATHEPTAFVGPLYFISLDRLAARNAADFGDDSLEGWKQHLSSKVWFSVAHSEALDVAHAAAFRAPPKTPAPTKARAKRNIHSGAAYDRKVSPRLRAAVFERDGFRCRRCGASADDGARLEPDHILPASRGGPTAFENLQTLCFGCNRGKRDSVPHAHDQRAFPAE